MKWILKMLLSSLAVLAASYLLPGVHIANFVEAILVAVVLGVLNATLGAFLKVVSCLVNVLTLGFLSLVINALMVLIADHFLKGFQVDGFWWALLFSVLVSVFNWVLNKIFKEDKDKDKKVKLFDKDGRQID